MKVNGSSPTSYADAFAKLVAAFGTA